MLMNGRIMPPIRFIIIKGLEMSKKDVGKKELEIDKKDTIKIQELLQILKKDEETLRNTIMNANGQLQYNKKMQGALQQLLDVK